VKWFQAKGITAARLRQRKHTLLREFRIPDSALPGSLVVTHRRCGKTTCHCASSGKGHPMWQLTFMVDGNKRVETMPKEWVDQILPLVERGKEYKGAVAEVFAINAQLLALWCKENRNNKKRGR
jgi:hypothetical protein